MADENYRQIKRDISGITVYTDGSRFAWPVHGLWAWLTSAGFVDGTPGGTAEEIREGVLEDLVAATKSTPFISSPNRDPRCEPQSRSLSYGETIPGRWLEEIIVSIGAPGGHPASRSEVSDTGTTLRIDIPAYKDSSIIYATILTPGIDPNVTPSSTERKIGRRGSYNLYFDDGNAWQSYKASNGTWQLSLLAYPGADNDEVTWPEGTIDWLNEAVGRAQQSPPKCRGPLT